MAVTLLSKLTSFKPKRSWFSSAGFVFEETVVAGLVLLSVGLVRLRIGAGELHEPTVAKIGPVEGLPACNAFDTCDVERFSHPCFDRLLRDT